MLGNGRETGTYGVSLPTNPTMKTYFIYVVFLTTCNSWVAADPEFYPDQSINPELQRLLEKQGELLYSKEPPKYPLLESYRNRHQGQTWNNFNTKLQLRINQIARKFRELNDRSYKIPNTMKHTGFPIDIYKSFPDKNFLTLKPHFGILDDVRANPQINVANYKGLPLQKDDVKDNGQTDLDEPKDENQNNADRSTEENRKKLDLDGNGPYLLNDPSDFAYPPSDARYFEDWPKEDTSDLEDVGDEEHVTNHENILVQQRKEENYYDRQNPPNNGIDQRYSEDAMEVVAVKPRDDPIGVYIIAIVAGISAAATVGLIAFAIGWYNLQKHVKNASGVDYPAYGVTGPNKDLSPSGDRRLAQSAQMYHYQHQKQQIIAMERAATNERQGSVSEADSDEENEGDYTVYECPGLAPTGEMEVKNPMFQDDPTPAHTPALQTTEEKK